MCGIVGYVEKASEREHQTILARMLKRLDHRGPDGEGGWHSHYQDWGIHLGHRRLAILDLTGGAQPLGREGVAWITFNGEIYNYIELRERLITQGVSFTTRSDTEVLLHHYVVFGEKSLHELNGMFAFALWNEKTGELVLARDRAGIKPLYYCHLPDRGLVFSSELTALLPHSGVPRTVSLDALASYFFSDYIPFPQTALKGVHKLPPGTFLKWRDGKIDGPHPFWSIENVAPAEAISSDERMSAQLEERMRAAVKRQMISDVPLGVFLSGGIDSSSVAALAQKTASEPILTFSIRFEEASFDESEYARAVARWIGSRHAERTLSNDVLLDTIGRALACLDEPLADSSILPTYLLSGFAAEHVKVALGGDGGDELWAGYPTYFAHKVAGLYGRTPGWFRDELMERVIEILPTSDRYQSLEWKAKRFTHGWDPDPVRRHLRWMSDTDLDELPSIFTAGAAEPVLLSLFRRPLLPDPLNAMMALDFSTYMVGSVLTKVDRASMAHGLEVRPPLLDNELIELAFSLPASLKHRGHTGKVLLKRATERLLPDRIRNRRKKGFAIPCAAWLRGPLQPLLHKSLDASPLWEKKNGAPAALVRDIFLRWHQEHQSRARDRSKPLWALIVLDQWLKRESLHDFA